MTTTTAARRTILKSTYMFVVENWAPSTTEVADAIFEGNAEKARTALKALSGLVESIDVNDEAQGSARQGGYKALQWQSYFDVENDDTALANAEVAFDAAYPLPQSTQSPNTTSNEEAVMSEVKFVREDEKKGKKLEQVATMVKALRDANGTPIAFEKLCDDAGAKYPQDVQAAMFALELTGLIDRFSFVEEGSTRSRTAYSWHTNGDTSPASDEATPAVDPTTAGDSKPASKSRSRSSKATPAKDEAAK